GVVRVPATKGAATYTWTVSGVTGAVGAAFHGWLWEPPTEVGPVIALVQQPKPRDYDGYDGAPVKPTDASIDVLNALHESIAAEFGPRVNTVDTSSMDKSTNYFGVGIVHPNLAEHAELARLTTAAMRAESAYVTAANDSPSVPATPPPA